MSFAVTSAPQPERGSSDLDTSTESAATQDADLLDPVEQLVCAHRTGKRQGVRRDVLIDCVLLRGITAAWIGAPQSRLPCWRSGPRPTDGGRRRFHRQHDGPPRRLKVEPDDVNDLLPGKRRELKRRVHDWRHTHRPGLEGPDRPERVGLDRRDLIGTAEDQYLDPPGGAASMAAARKVMYQASQGLNHMRTHHTWTGGFRYARWTAESRQWQQVLVGPSPVGTVWDALDVGVRS